VSNPSPASRGFLAEVAESLWAGLVFLASGCWKWGPLSGIALFLLALGVSAMYGAQYILAAGLYFIGIALLTARFAADAKSHARKGGVIFVIIVAGAIVFSGSLWLVKHTSETQGHHGNVLSAALSWAALMTWGYVSAVWTLPLGWISIGLITGLVLASIVHVLRTRGQQQIVLAPQQDSAVADSSCQDQWLHEKLKTDKATIWDLVWVASIFYRQDFDKSQPRIDFVFNIINNSLIDVLISMEGGCILFSDDSEQFYFDPKFMGPNPVLCKSRDTANFTIRQAVTGDEITKHFKSADNTRISFGNLSVSFRGTERFPEITSTHLDVNHYLFTAEGAWYNPNRPKFLSEQESDLQRVQIASPKPKITLIKDSGKRVYLNARTDTYTFFAASSGNPAVVARFRNEAETSVPVKGVRARIVYFDANGEERGNVSHGAWLDEPYNYTDFAVGGERTLVLGGTEDSQWVRGTAGAEGFWRQVTLEGLSTIQDNREGPAKAKQKPTWGKVLDKHIRIKVTLYTDSGPIGSDFCFEFIPGTPFTFRPIECEGS
jgi:hypothetical protein